MDAWQDKNIPVWKVGPLTATVITSNPSGKFCTKDFESKHSRETMATPTHLIAPAVVLGPNHCPTSFLSPFLASTILCTLNGHSVDGESKNHVKIWT